MIQSSHKAKVISMQLSMKLCRLSIIFLMALAISLFSPKASCELAATTSDNVPQRIGTATLASDEIVWELLKRIGKEERLIAVSTLWGHARFSRYRLEELPSHVEGRIGDNIESLLKLKPDLVLLASYNRPEYIRQVQSTGIKVLIQERFLSVEDITANILQIGEHIGAKSAAKDLVSEMQARLDQLAKRQISNKNGRKLRFLNYSSFGTLSGKDTSFDSMIQKVGGVNLSAEIGLKGWSRLSDEVLVTLNPDVIIAVMGDENQEETLSQMLKTNWKHLEAVKERRIIFIPEKLIQSVSHHMIEAIEYIHSETAKFNFVITKSEP